MKANIEREYKKKSIDQAQAFASKTSSKKKRKGAVKGDPKKANKKERNPPAASWYASCERGGRCAWCLRASPGRSKRVFARVRNKTERGGGVVVV